MFKSESFWISELQSFDPEGKTQTCLSAAALNVYNC